MTYVLDTMLGPLVVVITDGQVSSAKLSGIEIVSVLPHQITAYILEAA